jgi:hypothetical protein
VLVAITVLSPNCAAVVLLMVTECTLAFPTVMPSPIASRLSATAIHPSPDMSSGDDGEALLEPDILWLADHEWNKCVATDAP